MKKAIRYLLPLLLCAITAIPGDAAPAKRKPSTPAAPSKIEDLPRIPMDTIPTKDSLTKVIIYTNNTWSYYRPEMRTMDDLPVYRNHWDTTQIFAYRSVELRDLPQAIELPLISSLDDYHYPIKGRVFSRFGPRGRRNHNGVDIPLKVGEPIYASFDGRVRYAKYNTGGYGYLVILRHKNGLETWHAHLTKVNVKPNDYVKSGQVIGFGGNTGRSRGPHLHFETRYSDQTFDPERLIDFESGSLRYQTFVLEKSYMNIHSRASDQLEEDDDSSTDNMTLLLAESGEGESASEDILDKIAKAQQKPATVSKASTSGTVYHTIRQGDMLGSISRRYGVSIDQICRLNPGLTRTTVLKLGRQLRIK